MLVKKNYRWIWIAVDRYGKTFINFVVGDRSAETEQTLWDDIKDQLDGKVATDYWQPYEHFIPEDDHIQSKAETYTVEGYNSLFRHFLARMRRQSKCDTKSVRMLELSILLLMHKRNGTLSILY
jgi:insertion element IS1 protein InsB